MVEAYKPRRRDFGRTSSRTVLGSGIHALCALACWLTVETAGAQTITTVAGNGSAGFTGDNVAAISAGLNAPRGVAFDSQGNMYIADRFNHRIRRVAANGTITTVAGNGTAGFSGDGGPAVNAGLNQPEDVWVDGGGTIYLTDSSNHRIRRVSGGVISTIAGSGGPGFTGGFAGDGGPATSAQLNRPTSIAIDSGGNIFIADSSNQRIRRVAANGTISTVAGNGSEGYSGDGGGATSASLDFPVGLNLDSAGNLYIADAGNHVIRRVTPQGTITTAVGNGVGAGTDTGSFSGDGGAATSAGLNTPEDVAIDSNGTLFIADTANYRVRRVTGGVITTIAGTGFNGFAGDGGPATSALLNLPWSARLDAGGNLYVGDFENHRVRRIGGVGSAAASPGFGPVPPGLGAPQFSSNGVVDGASFRGPIAAGAIVSLFGQNLSSSTQNASSLPLPTNLNGTSVTINGTAAPLFYVSQTQLNVQLPFNVGPGGVTVQVSRDGVASSTQTVNLSSFAPAIFTVPSGGSGPGAILHSSSGALVTSSAPAARGEFLSIYGTGLGPVQPPVAAGAPGPTSPVSNTITPVSVTIGGITVGASFAGLAPTFAGLYQVNVQVPQGVASSGAVPVTISVGGAVSNTVTIAVQ